MNDGQPTPAIADPPQLQKMVSETRNQVRILGALVLKTETQGDTRKARNYQLAKQRMESALHVLEALQHWIGPDADDKKIWHVLSHLLESPPPSLRLAEALKNYAPAIAEVSHEQQS